MVPRSLVSPLAIVLTVLGLAVATLGIVYLVVASANLPGFVPGHLAIPTHAFANGRVIRTHAEKKRGVVVLCAAAFVFAGAWYLRFRYEPMD